MSPDNDFANIRDTVSALLGRAVASVEPVRGGRNNQIFRLNLGDETYAVKRYPPPSADRRDRLETEFTVLRFLRDQGIDCVPRPIARDDTERVGIYEWIEGRRVAADERRVEELAAFFIRLQRVRAAAAKTTIGKASASCFSINDAVAQLYQRRKRLASVQDTHDALNRFLVQRLDPAVERVVAELRSSLSESEFGADLEPGLCCLSASDFGFHNALARADGRMTFLDFEYFGWDDPVKAVADVLLHPGMDLSASERVLFHGRVIDALTPNDTNFEERFRRLFSIYGLIWCLIVLNDFLPDFVAQRQAAGAIDGFGAELRARQLSKASNLLSKVVDENGHGREFVARG